MKLDHLLLGKVWSPISRDGKRRWRREIHHHHHHHHHRKVAKNWQTIENARKVLLVPENRATYDAVRAERGYDREISMEWDIAGSLQDRNEDFERNINEEQDYTGDNESVVARWSGWTGK
jgi:hypothetical protein